MHARGHAHIWTQGIHAATVTATGVQTEVKKAVGVLSMYYA